MKSEVREQLFRVLLKKNLTLKFFVLNFSVLSLLFLFITISSSGNVNAQSVDDPNLVIEPFAEGLVNATSMAFLDPDNILILEREGAVRLVSNGQLQPEPVLEVPVNSAHVERGLLGIAILNDTVVNSSETSIVNFDQEANLQTVFLYFTENVTAAAGTENVTAGNDSLRNRVYKYDWNKQTRTLENPSLLVDLPASSSGYHNAGKLMIGPDNLLYGIIGDSTHEGQLQNFKDGPPPDDTGMIFRVNPSDGSIPSSGNPFSSDPSNPLSKYYAYGIRNSFGLTFDPITGNIWTTENGLTSYDEINLVKPGFNSGWRSISGPISASNITEVDLVKFEGSHYADPILSWFHPPGITDIEFLNSSSLGEKYSNNMFVGDYNNGHLYYFELVPNRTALDLENTPELTDLVVNDEEERPIIFGGGFLHITDLVTGPGDGYLYILSYGDPGMIYRIMPA